MNSSYLIFNCNNVNGGNKRIIFIFYIFILITNQGKLSNVSRILYQTESFTPLR